MSETIQKRALVTPDEIGQLFARIDDRAHHAYPGLALAVISGARPVALRRVNYYEDFQFMGLFDAHPDHPLVAPQVVCVNGRDMGRLVFLFAESPAGLKLAGWECRSGGMVKAGDPVGLITTKKDSVAGHLRAPRTGRFKALTDNFSEGPLYQVEYYDAAAPESRAIFDDLIAFAERYIGFIREQKRSATLAAVLFSVFAGIALFMAAIGISPVWCVLAGLGFAGVAGFMVFRRKAAEIVLAKCGLQGQ